MPSIFKRAVHERKCVGWREWISLPDLGVVAIKAKIDSGAKTSAIHAYNIKTLTQDGKKRVQFTVFPEQRSKRTEVHAEADLVGERYVRSSMGHLSLRPVIRTTLAIAEYALPIELTLVDRDVMGFRMLIGRQAIRNRMLIDPGRSYLLGPRLSTGIEDAESGEQ